MDEHAKLTQDFTRLAVARAFDVNYSNNLFFEQKLPFWNSPFSTIFTSAHIHTYWSPQNASILRKPEKLYSMNIKSIQRTYRYPDIRRVICTIYRINKKETLLFGFTSQYKIRSLEGWKTLRAHSYSIYYSKLLLSWDRGIKEKLNPQVSGCVVSFNRCFRSLHTNLETMIIQIYRVILDML